jgi:hypothetical protein
MIKNLVGRGQDWGGIAGRRNVKKSIKDLWKKSDQGFWMVNKK